MRSALFLLGIWAATARPAGAIEFDEALTRFSSEYLQSYRIENVANVLSVWSGYQTLDGARQIVEAIVREQDGMAAARDLRTGGRFMLHYCGAPRAEIVSHLLEQALAEKDGARLEQYFILLAMYPEDARIVPFLAGYFGHRKPVILRSEREDRREAEATGRAAWRVCDAAHRTVCQVLLKRGRIDRADLAIGIAGGAADIAERDKVIEAMQAWLSEHPARPELARAPLDPAPFRIALEAFGRYTRKATTPPGEPDPVSLAILWDWPECATIEGARLLVETYVDESMLERAPGKVPAQAREHSDRRVAAGKMLRLCDAPRPEVVSHLLQRLHAEQDAARQLIYMLMLPWFPEDARIVPSLASLFDIKTWRKEPRTGRMEPAETPPMRVCDSAHGIICQILLKRGVIDDNDPAVGSPTDNFQRRDAAIAAMKLYLQSPRYRPPAATDRW